MGWKRIISRILLVLVTNLLAVEASDTGECSQTAADRLRNPCVTQQGNTINDPLTCFTRGCHWCTNREPNCFRGKACYPEGQQQRVDCWNYNLLGGNPNSEGCRRLGCSWCPFGQGPWCAIPTGVVDECTAPDIQRALRPCTATDESSCHDQGCSWCPGSPTPCSRKKTCFSGPLVDCWDYIRIAGNPNPKTCAEVGCAWCPSKNPSCVFDEPFCERDGADRPECFNSAGNPLLNQADCEAQQGCRWCPYSRTPNDPWCARLYTPAGTTISPTTPPPALNDNGVDECTQPLAQRQEGICDLGANPNSCRTLGCFWCDDLDVKCYQGKACSQLPKRNCWNTQWGSTPNAKICLENGCAWCLETSSCIHKNPFCETSTAEGDDRPPCLNASNMPVTTETECEAAGCLWCPHPKTSSDPVCVRDVSVETTAAPATTATTAPTDPPPPSSVDECTQTVEQRNQNPCLTQSGSTITDETTCLDRGCHWCTDFAPNCFRGKACYIGEREDGWDYNAITDQNPNSKRCRQDGHSWCPFGVGPWCAKDQLFCERTGTYRPQCYNSAGASVTTQSACNAEQGCRWCPFPPKASDPLCVREVVTNPTDPSIHPQCFNSSRENCYSYIDPGINEVSCLIESRCVFCPNAASNEPKCVVDPNAPSTTASTTTLSTSQPLDAICTAPDNERINCYSFVDPDITEAQCLSDSSCSYCPNQPAGKPKCLRVGCPVGHIRRYNNLLSCCNDAGGGRIVGGVPSSLRQWGWIGALYYNGVFRCAAVLLDSTHAITAGHCIGAIPFQQHTIEFGTLDLYGSNSELQRVTVQDYTFHPDYDSSRRDNDIAVLNFVNPVNTNADVFPINLPGGEVVPVGSTCYVAGWGATDPPNYDDPSDVLREVAVDILDFQICANAYGGDPFVTMTNEKMLCVGKITGGADSCQGDSGGPVMCQGCDSCDWYVAGIVNFGYGCALANYPGVYARIQYFEDWIKSEGVVPLNPGPFVCDTNYNNK